MPSFPAKEICQWYNNKRTRSYILRTSYTAPSKFVCVFVSVHSFLHNAPMYDTSI